MATSREIDIHQNKIWKIVALISRIIIAVVFIGAAVPKIIAPHEFAIAIFRYQVAPYPTVNIGAVLMPWIELVVGVAILFIPRMRDAAAVIIFGMLAFFAIAIMSAIFRGIDIGCGCFSVNPHAQTVGWLSIIRNIALMILTAIVFFDTWQKKYTPQKGSIA